MPRVKCFYKFIINQDDITVTVSALVIKVVNTTYCKHFLQTNCKLIANLLQTYCKHLLQTLIAITNDLGMEKILDRIRIYGILHAEGGEEQKVSTHDLKMVRTLQIILAYYYIFIEWYLKIELAFDMVTTDNL